MDSNAGGDQTLSIQCSFWTITTVLDYVRYGVSMLVLILAPKAVHLAFGRLGQTRLISEMIVGFILGNWTLVRSLMDSRVPDTLDGFMPFTVIAYFFVTGLEMDVGSFFRWNKREVVMSYAGTITTVALFFLLNPLLQHTKFNLNDRESWSSTWALAFLFANTSSQVLTRLTTELKIGKSDIGRLAVKAGLHSDMITTSFLIFLHITLRNKWIGATRDMGEMEGLVSRDVFQLGFFIFGCAFQVVLLYHLIPRFMSWIEERNPSGKRVKDTDITMMLVVIIVVCIFSGLFTFSSRSTAFIMGLMLQREGRAVKQLIRRINFFLYTLGIPLYLFSIGLTAPADAWAGSTTNSRGEVVQWSWSLSFSKLVLFFFLTSFGKIFGTTIAALYYRFHLPEAIALGLLLNVKGMFHIFIITGAKESKLVSQNSYLVLLLVILISIMYVPLVVAMIVWRARKLAHNRLLGLQWHDPASELRIVVGIHGPKNVPAFINVIEATRGGPQSSPLVVYAMDLIELTDRAAATLVHEMGGLEAVTVMDEGITETRKAISHALDSYARECGEGLTIRRLIAVSSYSTMYQDICNGAEDTMSVLIILPFHRNQRIDGGMDMGHNGHRLVNQKVLQSARCSVGILVDRGLAGANTTAVSQINKQVAVIFIGGSDDREALIFAGRMAQHPGISLTAIRFLHDAEAGEVSRPSVIRGHVLALVNRQERELQLDDACFMDFYERYIADDRVGYMEKYVSNGSELVATLRNLQSVYNLFVVGAGVSRDSTMTAGMGDWAECPELGPIGDVLASSDFSVTTSVLVIQQHTLKKNLDDIAEEFAVI